jgi:DNA polymerase-1
MRHLIFEEADNYSIALLIKPSAFNKRELTDNYLAPLLQSGIKSKDVIAFTADYNEAGKAPAGFIKDYLAKLLPALQSLGVTTLYVADSSYFKVLAGQPKAEPHFGYVLPCKIKGFEHMNVVLGLNHAALIYNPDLHAKLDLSLKTLSDHVAGNYQPIGQDIIHSAHYPEGLDAITKALEQLHSYPALTADIEAFSLDFDKAGIGTITFCWDEHNGMAFACDYTDKPPVSPNPCAEIMLEPGRRADNPEVRALIKRFLETYQGEITWHKSSYDVKVLIYTLWMKNGLDTEGLLEGLEVMCRRMHDTKIIAYLAVNSTAGNVLGLKHLAHEFAGNWAVEVTDIRKVPLAQLLRYNLIDGLSTWFVKKKYWPIMVADQQLELYKGLMMPSQKMLLQTELTGMPLSPVKVAQARAKLEAIIEEHIDVIVNSGLVQMTNLLLRKSDWEKDFEARRSKAKNPDKIFPKAMEKFDSIMFNPNSGPQLQRLLYEVMGLPIIDLTDTKQPATGAETIEKLINHTTIPEYKQLLSALIGYGQANKVLTTFIPAFEAALIKGDGVMWLHGSFNLGGTVSNRLSSSNPNLQNIPANSIYGKLIKECFVAPQGWLFCGADFNSLEDMISALTTKDPNKIRVYTDGYDGHCLRAFAYFGDQMPDIRQAAVADRCFKVKTKTNTLLLKSGDLIISPSGDKIPVEEYFDTYRRV